MYRQGFCPHGGHCRYRHIRRKDLPEVADFTIGRETAAIKRPFSETNPPGEKYKVMMCKNFLKEGSCSYGDEVCPFCFFAILNTGIKVSYFLFSVIMLMGNMS